MDYSPSCTGQLTVVVRFPHVSPQFPLSRDPVPLHTTPVVVYDILGDVVIRFTVWISLRLRLICYTFLRYTRTLPACPTGYTGRYHTSPTAAPFTRSSRYLPLHLFGLRSPHPVTTPHSASVVPIYTTSQFSPAFCGFLDSPYAFCLLPARATLHTRPRFTFTHVYILHTTTRTPPRTLPRVTDLPSRFVGLLRVAWYYTHLLRLPDTLLPPIYVLPHHVTRSLRSRCCTISRYRTTRSTFWTFWNVDFTLPLRYVRYYGCRWSLLDWVAATHVVLRCC